MKLDSVLKLPEFEKDLKALLKRFRSLESDLDTFIQSQLTIYHLHGIDNGGIERIPGLSISHPGIYKARKFACRALKGRGAKSGIRVIYAYDESAKNNLPDRDLFQRRSEERRQSEDPEIYRNRNLMAPI